MKRAVSGFAVILVVAMLNAVPAGAHDALLRCEVVKGVAYFTAEFPNRNPMKGPIYIVLDAKGGEVTTGVGDGKGKFSVTLPKNYDGYVVIARDLLGHRSVYQFPSKVPQP